MSATIGDVELDETITCVREQYEIVTGACATLAESLRAGSVDEGLRALERICATLLVAEELLESTARAGAPAATLKEAHRLRERMLRSATPWIAAAVRDLPGAEVVVHQFAFSHRGAPRPSERSRGTQ